MKAPSQLLQRLRSRTASVVVVGQGYVGLSVAAGAATCGMHAYGIDRDAGRIQALSEGRNVVPGVLDSTFTLALDTGRLSFGTDLTPIESADVVLICVPTPVVEHRPDMSYIESAAAAVAPHLRAGTLVVLESTTYPGTTEQILQPLLEAGGLRATEDFLLAYSPERIDPGNAKYGLQNTPRVVGGLGAEATEAVTTFYAQLVDEVVTLSSPRAAELAKLLENTFRMVNIALVNELAQLCAEQGIDTWEVIKGAASKPFGFMPFYPGPGVGGHCIPLDPTYLAWQSRRDTGRPFRLVEMAQDINAQMPDYVARRVVDALNDRDRSVRGAKILALGITYKPDVGDVRESAALHVIAQLQRKGAVVVYADPFVERVDEHGVQLDRVELDAAAVAEADCVLLLTPHSVFDLPWLVQHARFLFDARNATGARDLLNVVTL